MSVLKETAINFAKNFKTLIFHNRFDTALNEISWQLPATYLPGS